MEITEKGKKALTKEDSSVRFKETGNKKDYLPKGVYKIQIDNENTTLEIK